MATITRSADSELLTKTASSALTVNLKEALKWFQKAMEGDDDYAQRRLGVAYENGEFGLTVNHKVALMRFQKAAERGGDYAQCRLEDAHEDGEFGPDG